MISYHIYRKVTEHRIVKKAKPKLHKSCIHTVSLCVDGTVFETIKHIVTGRLL